MKSDQEAIEKAIATLSPTGFQGSHRPEHLERLKALFENAKKSSTGSVVAVEGTPGTGKTCTIKYFLEQCKARISLYWNPQTEGVSPNDAKTGLENFISTSTRYDTLDKFYSSLCREKEIAVLAVDEYDSIGTSLTPILRELLTPPSKLFLITVTNTLSSSAEFGLPIQRLSFEAYSPDELKEIITERLCGVPFQPAALKLLTTRVGNWGGDARAALVLAQHALRAALLEGTTPAIRHVAESSKREREGLTELENLVMDVGPQGRLLSIKRQVAKEAKARCIVPPSLRDLAEYLDNLVTKGYIRKSGDVYSLVE